ncbi:MAG: inositol monophosphatase [Acidobacteria bacterium]|nr:inositol monophosphatase [Acidobacteriota bacterium]
MRTEGGDSLLEVASAAARLAGSVLESNFGKALQVKKKTSAIDLVTDMDVKSEQIIVDYIARHFPGHAILAEESSHVDADKESIYKWIIDPLDGTTNYAHGYPVYCVSIAIEVNGVVVAGAIYGPPLKEMFTAIRGEGTRLNGREVHVSVVADLGEALTVTGFPYDVRIPPHTNLEYFARFLKTARAVRRDGSAALNLAYVAAGRFDGFWELKLRPWDIAAGILMVQEAGGKVTNFRGAEIDVYQSQILASNGKIHEQMLELLGE